MFTGELRYFPLVVHKSRGEISESDIVMMRGFYRDVHARKQPFVHLVDARSALRPDSLVRTKLAEFTAETLAETKLLQVANAIVLDSRLTAGVITALRWAVPSPVPEKYVASIAEGMAWLEKHAKPRGLVITSDARAFMVRLHLDAAAAA